MNTARTFVRSLTAAERQALERGRKSADAFTVRRSQILLASADGLGPAAIGRLIGCTAQAVRDAVRAFEADGPGCLTAKSHARKDPGRVWGGRALDQQRRTQVLQEKKVRDRLIERAVREPGWGLGFQDGCPWAGPAQADLFARAAGDPLRLGASARDPKGGGPEAVACY